MITCFPPLVSAEARILILGSFPGDASLQRREYYAHPRNAFWSIVQTLLRLEDGLSYVERGQALVSHGIALWDVLSTCERKGSLDSSIDDRTIIVNDFRQFFRQYPGIGWVFFNGMKAEREYQKKVLGSLGPNCLQYRRLPSTSPAMATLSREDKLARWTEIMEKIG
ncbi:MAG: DNA-deoxyinosine glycosylase [Desulfocapsaceae bacterium]|nr:DNA-deoxyinosine glycosylase [Desulfocapsaceae bacterium]